MPELSHATQAVLTAFNKYPLHGDHIANNLMHGALPAALRAVVDQVLPENAEHVGDEHDAARADQWLRIRLKMLAIAAELEAR